MARATKIPASDVRAQFSARLRMLRHAFGQETGNPGITQKEFAELLGIEPERYGTYERGIREPPLSVLASIRRVTGVNLNGLIAGDIDKAA
ncbi:helix-turn-helix domain-containing protein [Acetobacter estunensis]|uniref:helix-turn-helix domain-containing protein n=1 Tax=Acetobacter estunensis TaxID=104097 RepID=UPI001C2DA207|nr:helix-turn-helix transcriptional regulator [Acetobacter estunensis]